MSKNTSKPAKYSRGNPANLPSEAKVSAVYNELVRQAIWKASNPKKKCPADFVPSKTDTKAFDFDPKYFDARPLNMPVLEAKHELGLSYPNLRVARLALHKVFSKTAAGKILLVKKDRKTPENKLASFVQSVGTSHPGLIQALFNSDLKVNMAELARLYGITRERVRQIKFSIETLTVKTGTTIPAILKTVPKTKTK